MDWQAHRHHFKWFASIAIEIFANKLIFEKKMAKSTILYQYNTGSAQAISFNLDFCQF